MKKTLSIASAVLALSSVTYAQDTVTDGYKELTQDNISSAFSTATIPSLTGKWEIINGNTVDITSYAGTGSYSIGTSNGKNNLLLISNGTLICDTTNQFLLRGMSATDTSEIEIGENGKFMVNNMELRGTLVLRAENGLTNAAGTGLTTVRLENQNGAPTIKIYANQKIKLNLNGVNNAYTKEVSFVFGADKELTINKITAAPVTNFDLVLKDFVENGSIFFGDATAGMEDTLRASNKITVSGKEITFVLKTSEGATVDIDSSEWNWEATTRDGVSGYLLSYGGATIPEPAEWAAIFGAIALGLAIYRRRK